MANDIDKTYGIKEEELIKLPHGFVGASNGDHWCIWESIEDFRSPFYPYEGECEFENGKTIFKKVLTEDEARKFANKQHRSIKKKYAEGC